MAASHDTRAAVSNDTHWWTVAVAIAMDVALMRCDGAESSLTSMERWVEHYHWKMHAAVLARATVLGALARPQSNQARYP